MGMTISTNNNTGIPYTQYGTDRQKARAEKFINKSDAELYSMAYKINNQGEKDKKFAKGMAIAFASLPLVGGLAAGIATKGKLSTKTLAGMKNFAKNAVGLAIPVAVVGAHSKMTKSNQKYNEFDKKHPLLTLGGLLAVTTVAADVVSAVGVAVSPKAKSAVSTLSKKLKLNRLAEKLDKAPEAIHTLASKVSSKISLPNGVKERLSTISSKVKIPQILKDGYKKVANAKVTKDSAKFFKKIGKTIAKHPIGTALCTMLAVGFGHAIKKNKELENTKQNLKLAQQQTATNLINAYANENESLKNANLESANILEKANNEIQHDSVDNIEE